MESPLWLRRLGVRPMIVRGIPGIEGKPLRDCTDEELEALNAFHAPPALHTANGLLREDWVVRLMLEKREFERNPFEGEPLLCVLGFVWRRLLLDAACRSSAVRLLCRARGRIEDFLLRFDRADYDLDGDELAGRDQIAVQLGKSPRS